MAHPNEELVRTGYAAFGSGDMETLRRLFAPDIVWHSPGRNPVAGDFHGVDQVLQLFGRLFQLTGGTLRLDLHDVLANDEHVVALIHNHAERGGRAVDTNDTHVFHVRDGRVTEFWALSGDPYATDELLSS